MTAYVSQGVDKFKLAAIVAHELNDQLRAHFGQGPGLKQAESTSGKFIEEAIKDGEYPLNPEASWKRWKEARKAQGWTFDPTYDKEKKKHPNLVENYHSLPEDERIKDYVYWAAINAILIADKHYTYPASKKGSK